MCSLRNSESFTPENLKRLVDDYVKSLPKKSWHNWQVNKNLSFKLLLFFCSLLMLNYNFKMISWAIMIFPEFHHE